MSKHAVLGTLSNDLQTQATILGGFIILIWVLEAIDQLLLRGQLDRLGIFPRRTIGLRGILFAPLLHGSWKHLATNTPPLVILGWLVMIRSLDEFFIVTAVVWLVSGVGVWLLAASNTLHIGASGLIFGYFGFLLLRSYFEQDLTSATFSVIVAVLYGPIIWGVLLSSAVFPGKAICLGLLVES